MLFTGGGRDPRHPRDPRVRSSGTRGLSQSLRCAIASLFASLSLSLRFTSLSLRFAFRFASLRFASLRFSNRTESNLEAHTPTGRRIYIGKGTP